MFFRRMKTYPLHDDKDGRLYAFEVSNTLLGRKGALQVAAKIPEVRILKKPKFLSWFKEDVFCEFELNNKLFTILEPFGDNSRYLISKEPVGYCGELELIQEAFKNA
jgi:hypothetical protein